MGILHVPHQHIGPEAGRRSTSFPEICGGLFHYRDHIAGVAGKADEAYPVQTSQHSGSFRYDKPGIQPLVEIHPNPLSAHPVDLLQAEI